MQLIDNEAKALLPALYAQDGKGDDAIVYVKLFNPCGAATWWLTEYDPCHHEAFGLCDLGYGPELGYVSITELEGIKVGPGGCLGIERDLYWTPKTLREVKASLGTVAA